MKNKPLKILIIIFLLSLAFNLYLSLSSPYLNNGGSYFNLRVIDNIKENGLPIFYDDLSYGGRPLVLQYFFHYFMTIFSFIPLYFKIIPSLLISSLVIISYFIAKEITNDETSSLLTSLLSGFVPIYSKILINQFTIYAFVLPLIALILLFLMKLEKKKYSGLFILFSFILSLTSSLSFLLLFILIFYVLLMNAENIKLIRLKKEILIFSFFLIFLVNVLLFRISFMEYGFNIIYGNNPILYSFNFFNSIYFIGIIPLFFGAIGLYQGFFKLKKESIVLISSLILGILFLLLLNIVNLNVGLLFLSFGLIIASSLSIKNFFTYLEKTKLSHIRLFFIWIFIFLFFILSLVPTYFGYYREFDDLSDFESLKYITEHDSVVLAPISYGHLITYFGGRINVIDTNFLLAQDPEQRYHDVDLIYGGWSYNKAVELIKDYNIDYIYINQYVKDLYNVADLNLENEKCIRKVEGSIYQFIC